MAMITAPRRSVTTGPPAVHERAPQRLSIKALMQRHPVLSYYVLTFAISWGGMVLVIGPGGIPGTAEQVGRLAPLAILVMVSGPPVTSLLLTGLVAGRAGLCELVARLLRWRVGARSYALALLTASLAATAVLVALSQRAPEFLPAIVTADDKASLLLSGIATELVAGGFEEVGWTGFVIPRLKRRHSVVTTGLMVGVLWGAWHFLANAWVSSSFSAAVPVAIFLPLYFLAGVAQLTAYRVLMVWLYDRTGSLLLAMLMHASLAATTVLVDGNFVLTPLTGVTFLTWFFLFSAALWIVVAAVVMANQGQLWRQLRRTEEA
jgi:uncharacterized protein